MWFMNDVRITINNSRWQGYHQVMTLNDVFPVTACSRWQLYLKHGTIKWQGFIFYCHVSTFLALLHYFHTFFYLFLPNTFLEPWNKYSALNNEWWPDIIMGIETIHDKAEATSMAIMGKDETRCSIQSAQNSFVFSSSSYIICQQYPFWSPERESKILSLSVFECGPGSMIILPISQFSSFPP